MIDLRYRAELQNLDPARGLRALFEAHPAEVKRIPVDSPFVARDMDTWDDYRARTRKSLANQPPERARLDKLKPWRTHLTHQSGKPTRRFGKGEQMASNMKN